MLELYANMLVLVTGGAGFIGSHVVEQLVNQHARVRIVDNLSTGHLENIAHVMEHVEFIKGSISDYETVSQAMQGVDVVFHLAAQVSVPGSVEDPVHCYATNIMGTLNILEAARHHGVKRVVFSSSSAVYGSQDGVFNEASTPTQPESPYGMSKLMGEMLMKQYYEIYGLETVSMRYFNVFGERQDPNAQYAAVVAKFKDNMRQNKPVVIFGTGLQTRDFVPVEKVAQANLMLGILPKEKVCNNIYNIATGKSINLLELFELLKPEFPQYNQSIEFKPARAGDVLHTRADCTRYFDVIR